MNVGFLAFTIAFAPLATSANASEPVPLHWDCTRSGTPSLHETAATFGYDNYSKVVAARDALHRQLRAICARGTRAVVVAPSQGKDAAADRRVAAGR